MERRSLAGVETSVRAYQTRGEARGLPAVLKWLWLQIKASWMEAIGISIRSGRDIWRPPFM